MTAMPYGQSLTILCLTELLVFIARKVRRKVHEKERFYLQQLWYWQDYSC